MTLLLPAVLPVLVVLIYAPSLPNDLVWDDRQLIVQNRFLEEGALGEIVRHGAFGGAGRDYDFYRPLQIISYYADLELWGRQPIRPWTLRLTNILLHGLNSLLVLLVCRRLFPRRTVAGWLTALLFAVHPLASESVAYVAGRADLLLVGGALGSLLFLLDFSKRHRPLTLPASYVCFALALLAKEAALIVPALLVFTLLIQRAGRPVRGRWSWWAEIAPIAGHLLLVGFYLLLRRQMLGPGTAPVMLADGGAAVMRVATTYADYARLLLWPDILQMERLTLPDPWRNLGYLVPWLTILAVTVTLLIKRPTRRAALLGSGWYVIGLLPVANVWQLNAAMAEHWLYLPGIGLIWLFAVLIETGSDRVRTAPAIWRRGIWVGVALALLLLGLRTAVRCQDWRTSQSIFAATLRYAPDSARAHTGLGAALGRQGQVDQAIGHLRRALALNPGSTDACNNLGAAYGRRGELDSCVVYLQRALRLEPNNADTHNNLGNAYALRKQPALAARAYREAVRLDPARPSGHFNLGRICHARGELAAARQAYETFLRLATGDPRQARRISAARQALQELAHQADGGEDLGR